MLQVPAASSFSPGVVVAVAAVSLSVLSMFAMIIIFAARITPALTTLTKVVDAISARQAELEEKSSGHAERLAAIEAERRAEQRRHGHGRRIGDIDDA